MTQLLGINDCVIAVSVAEMIGVWCEDVPKNEHQG